MSPGAPGSEPPGRWPPAGRWRILIGMGLLTKIRELGADAPLADGGETPIPEPQLGDDDPFTQLVADSLDELPDELVRALDDVPVIIGGDDEFRGVYGLYHGAGVARGDGAARIVINRDALSRDFGGDRPRLAAEIRRTVRHELAHHLGYSERGVAVLGL